MLKKKNKKKNSNISDDDVTNSFQLNKSTLLAICKNDDQILSILENSLFKLFNGPLPKAKHYILIHHLLHKILMV